jgi:hypothetical protein
MEASLLAAPAQHPADTAMARRTKRRVPGAQLSVRMGLVSGDRQSAGNEGAPRTRIALMGLIEAPSPSLVIPCYCLTRHVTAGDATRETADQADADAAAAANCTL